jgi:hypothetical protein
LNAFNRADVEALMEVCTEDFPFLPARSALDGGYRGEAGLRRYFEDNAETLWSSRCDSTRFTEPEIASSRSAADIPTAFVSSTRLKPDEWSAAKISASATWRYGRPVSTHR